MTAQELIGLVCKEFLQSNLQSHKWKMDKEHAKAIRKENVSAKNKVLERPS